MSKLRNLPVQYLCDAANFPQLTKLLRMDSWLNRGLWKLRQQERGGMGTTFTKNLPAPPLIKKRGSLMPPSLIARSYRTTFTYQILMTSQARQQGFKSQMLSPLYIQTIPNLSILTLNHELISKKLPSQYLWQQECAPFYHYQRIYSVLGTRYFQEKTL